MKSVLPWILAVVFAAAAGGLYFSKAAADAELAKVRDQAQQADSLRSQLDEAQKQVANLNDELSTARSGNDELLRLRNQVRQLTDDKTQLNKQLQASQSQVERSQAEVQQVQAQTAERAKSIAEQQILQMKQNQSATVTCINNLRILQGAKQQWALENNKPADAVPSPGDIAHYLPGQQLPSCPGGGQYTLNAVGANVTCSIPGHVLQ